MFWTLTCLMFDVLMFDVLREQDDCRMSFGPTIGIAMRCPTKWAEKWMQRQRERERADCKVDYGELSRWGTHKMVFRSFRVLFNNQVPWKEPTNTGTLKRHTLESVSP